MSYDVLVIGGGPAGLSAALNIRARGRSVLVVSNPQEENPLWRAEKVDNYLGMPGVTGAEMLQTMRRHAEAAGAEFREGKVLNTMRMGNSWYVSIGTDMENASAIVLAAGVARGKKFSGEEEYLGRGVSYCATCDGMLYRGKPVAVLGYSDTALHEAEFLRGIGCSVAYFPKPKDCIIRGESHVTGIVCDGEEAAVEGVFVLRQGVGVHFIHPGSGGNSGCGAGVVAGDHEDAQPHALEGSDGGGSLGLDGVGYGQGADELLLAGDEKGRFARGGELGGGGHGDAELLHEGGIACSAGDAADVARDAPPGDVGELRRKCGGRLRCSLADGGGQRVIAAGFERSGELQ